MGFNSGFKGLKLLSLMKGFSRGTEVRTTRTCCFQQSRSVRELAQYNARTFITSPNARHRPKA